MKESFKVYTESTCKVPKNMHCTLAYTIIILGKLSYSGNLHEKKFSTSAVHKVILQKYSTIQGKKPIIFVCETIVSFAYINKHRGKY